MSLLPDDAEDEDDESLVLKILLKRSHLNERRSFLPLPFSALCAFFDILPLSVVLFSLSSVFVLVLKDLLLTCGSFDAPPTTAVGSNEKCVVDFSALLALRGLGGGSKEKDDSVVVDPMGGAV